MKRIFLFFGIGLVALIIVAVIVGMVYIGPIIKMGVEQVAPQITQVSVKVDSVDVSLLTGSAKIKGLVVGNPQGFSSAEAISVGNTAISLDPLSVTSDKILIHSVQVESPEIIYEGGLLNGSNLTKILDNVNSFVKKNVPASDKPAPKIEIDDLLITGAKVQVVLSGVVNKEVSLPDIHLTNLGKDSNGLTPAELTSAILGAISKDTIQTVASSAGGISQGIQGLKNSFGGLFGK